MMTNLENMIGISEFDFSKQIEVFGYVYEKLLKTLPLQKWSFGGGTALSIFYFQHRMSYDINIFINDPQYFSFLSPKFYLEEIADVLQDKYIETANQIILTSKKGVKIDFLLAPSLSKKPYKIKILNNQEFQIETVEEIIAKKIFHRGKYNKARDIFDIAFAIKQDNLILKNLLDKQAINLDILYDFQNSVKTLDEKLFLEEIKNVKPTKESMTIANNAKDIILQNINNVLDKIKNLHKNKLRKKL